MHDHDHGGGYDPRTGGIRNLTITISDEPGTVVEGSPVPDSTGFTAHGTSIDHPHSHNHGNLFHSHAHTHEPGDTSHYGHHDVA